MKVLKFGGTVLKSSSDVKNVSKIISQLDSKEKNIIVISAFFGITNKLLEVATIASNGKDYSDKLLKIKNFHLEIINDLLINDSAKKNILCLFDELENILIKINNDNKLLYELQDNVLSFGERLSNLIVFCYLSKNKDVYQIFPNEIIKTDSKFGYASVLDESYELIRSCIQNINSQIIICAGFYASDKTGRITTIGRNGSDYTAALIANAIDASVLEIWKDTDGLYEVDPKIIKDARIIKQISYEEMFKFSSNGNKILQADSIYPCVLKNIPIILKNCYNINCAGTEISNRKHEKICSNISIIKLDNIKTILLSFKQKNSFLNIKNEILNILSKDKIKPFDNLNEKKILLPIIKFNEDKIFLSDLKNICSEECDNFIIDEDKDLINIVFGSLNDNVFQKILDKILKLKIEYNGNIFYDLNDYRIGILCNKSATNYIISILYKNLMS